MTTVPMFQALPPERPSSPAVYRQPPVHASLADRLLFKLANPETAVDKALARERIAQSRVVVQTMEGMAEDAMFTSRMDSAVEQMERVNDNPALSSTFQAALEQAALDHVQSFKADHEARRNASAAPAAPAPAAGP